MLHHTDKVICLYQSVFDNNAYISNILFECLSYKLFAGIGSYKVWKFKIQINLAQALLI